MIYATGHLIYVTGHLIYVIAQITALVTTFDSLTRDNLMSLQNGIVEPLTPASGGQRMASHPRPETFKALNNSGAAVGARMMLRLCTAMRSYICAKLVYCRFMTSMENAPS